MPLSFLLCEGKLSKGYHYVRWRWWDKIDVDKLADEFSKKYRVTVIPDHGWDLELTLMKDARDRYMIKSDTLTVFLSVFRVVLVQKKAAPFTSGDLELRARLLELFPRERPIFLPIRVSREPEFETVEEN